jgi:hypothetical protein
MNKFETLQWLFFLPASLSGILLASTLTFFLEAQFKFFFTEQISLPLLHTIIRIIFFIVMPLLFIGLGAWVAPKKEQTAFILVLSYSGYILGCLYYQKAYSSFYWGSTCLTLSVSFLMAQWCTKKPGIRLMLEPRR